MNLLSEGINLIDQLLFKTMTEKEKKGNDASWHTREDEEGATPVIVHPSGFSNIADSNGGGHTATDGTNSQNGHVNMTISFWENKEEEKKDKIKKEVVVSSHRRRLYMGRRVSGGKGRGA